MVLAHLYNMACRRPCCDGGFIRTPATRDVEGKSQLPFINEHSYSVVCGNDRRLKHDAGMGERRSSLMGG